MKERENQVTYTAANTYLSLNDLTAKTRNIWLVFHGIGYLSRYFLTHFRELDPEENYVIAPQAPSKYYLNNEYKHVGASWLTREQTAMEIDNVLNYVDAVYKAEPLPPHCSLLVFGYSQGVSVALRWVARSKIRCQHLVLYAGGIPNELRAQDFDFLQKNVKITLMAGDRDEFLDEGRWMQETKKATALFGERAEIKRFSGGHEIQKQLLKELLP